MAEGTVIDQIIAELGKVSLKLVKMEEKNERMIEVLSRVTKLPYDDIRAFVDNAPQVGQEKPSLIKTEWQKLSKKIPTK